MSPRQPSVHDDDWYLRDPRYLEAEALAKSLGSDHEVVQIPGTDDWAVVRPTEVPEPSDLSDSPAASIPLPNLIFVRAFGSTFVLIHQGQEVIGKSTYEVYRDPFDDVEARIERL